MRKICIPLLILAGLIGGCVPSTVTPAALSSATQSNKLTQEGKHMPALTLVTPAFKDGETIPVRNTCDGENKSPALTWDAPPQAARSLALIVDDPDAPVGVFTHWVIYNLPPTLTGLPEGVPQAAQPRVGGSQGMNNFRHSGYDGPCPPRGPVHRYFFKLYALDLDPSLAPGLTAQQLQKSIQGHILAEGQLMGRYSR